jgi:excisionase family DNA binding protein
MVDYCVLKTRKDLERQITDANTETYLSIDQVSKMLNKHRDTLLRWSEKGYLVRLKIGGEVCYRMSDVKRLLEGRK